MASGEELAHIVESHDKLGTVREQLGSYRNRSGKLSTGFWKVLEAVKGAAVASGDEDLAKATWCLGTTGTAQDHFVEAMDLLGKDQFYAGWCELERCEVALRALRRHYRPPDDRWGIRHMESHVAHLQDLFPYRVFISPSYVVREAECTICGAPAYTIRSGCNHRTGEIYGGEICNRLVTRADFIEVSFVSNPVQKYSVAFPERGFNYGGVRYVRQGLRHPWTAWSYERSERETDRKLYPSADRNDMCPCGSGLKYERCCINKRATKPHFQIIFGEPPPAGYPSHVDDASFWVTDELSSLRGKTEDQDTA